MDIKIDKDYSIIQAPHEKSTLYLIHHCGHEYSKPNPFCLIGYYCKRKNEIRFWKAHDLAFSGAINCGRTSEEVKNKFKFIIGKP